jgi:hypothetical protein
MIRIVVFTYKKPAEERSYCPGLPACGFRRPESKKALKFFFIRLLMNFGMKNPYEKEKTALTPALLREKAWRCVPSGASTITTCGNELPGRGASGPVDKRHPDVVFGGA